MFKYIVSICISFLFMTGIIFAQEGATPLPGMRGTASNLPDISVIGDIEGKISTNENAPDKDRILVREVELALQGYLYPQIRADIFLAMHRHEDNIEPEICEGYVSFLRLVNGLSLKTGKIHIDFGKINKIHQHERPYIDQPLVLNNFFGEHGLVGEGISFAYLFPLPFFTQIDIGAWRVAGGHHHHDEDAEEPPEFGLADEVYTTRLWTSFSLGQNSELEIGGSGAKGRGSHYLEHQDNAEIIGGDLTLKFWLSTYKRIIFQNEFLHLIREVPVGELKRDGFYSYIGYQHSKYWDLGLRYDWSENAFPDKVEANIISGIITKRLTETTKIRLQYNYELDSEYHNLFLQLVFGIGPHSHPLQ